MSMEANWDKYLQLCSFLIPIFCEFDLESFLRKTPRGVVVDEETQDSKFWSRGSFTRGDKCCLKHDPVKGRPHDTVKKVKDTDSAMQEIITRLTELEVTSKDILRTINICGVDTPGTGEKCGISPEPLTTKSVSVHNQFPVPQIVLVNHSKSTVVVVRFDHHRPPDDYTPGTEKKWGIGPEPVSVFFRKHTNHLLTKIKTNIDMRKSQHGNVEWKQGRMGWSLERETQVHYVIHSEQNVLCVHGSSYVWMSFCSHMTKCDIYNKFLGSEQVTTILRIHTSMDQDGVSNDPEPCSCHMCTYFAYTYKKVVKIYGPKFFGIVTRPLWLSFYGWWNTRWVNVKLFFWHFFWDLKISYCSKSCNSVISYPCVSPPKLFRICVGTLEIPYPWMFLFRTEDCHTYTINTPKLDTYTINTPKLDQKTDQKNTDDRLCLFSFTWW